VGEFLELLLTAIVVISLARGAIRILKNAFLASQADTGRPSAQAPPRQNQAEVLRKDPVCGTFVAASAAVQKTKNGQTYYFCSVECRDKF